MTRGQEQALSELRRISATSKGTLEYGAALLNIKGFLEVPIEVRVGLIDSAPGGLDLRERERFRLYVPPDFPFERPSLEVNDARFSGFPHVTWGRWICLFQTQAEWNPSDGMYGYFDRLSLWLRKAALNDMDPADGPLEPPFHVKDYSQAVFVIQADAPTVPDEAWFGFAEVEKKAHHSAVVSWNDLTRTITEGCSAVLAIFLPIPFPTAFPANVAEFIGALEQQGVVRQRTLRYLALAAKLTPEGEPIHLILGLPLRRGPDGSVRSHIAIWSIDPIFSESLKLSLPKDSDSDELLNLRKELGDAIYKELAPAEIKWCRVFENRPEIIVRRDRLTPMEWFSGKRVLILGCGALGSWIGEIIARAGAAQIDLVDNKIVTPGVLVRQDFRNGDIGLSKRSALQLRLKAVAPSLQVNDYSEEAHKFLTENIKKLKEYDLILDCTASSRLQMKIERDWRLFRPAFPAFASLLINSTANSAIGIVRKKGANGGIFDGYMRLKHVITSDRDLTPIAQAFYAKEALNDLFQPEPGCSDLTFQGSAADVMSLASASINNLAALLSSEGRDSGLAIRLSQDTPLIRTLQLPRMGVAKVGPYRVFISSRIFRKARSVVLENNLLRTPRHETGGLIWGMWNSAIGAIWIFDVSGPPPDSKHDPKLFVCGTEGTKEEHSRRHLSSYGLQGFLGFWHTHPGMKPRQSPTDIYGMAQLVANIGEASSKAVMLIFGRVAAKPAAGLYLYESSIIGEDSESIEVWNIEVPLRSRVV